MKVNFSTTLRGKKFYGDFYKQIYDEIVEEGYEVLDDWVIKYSVEEYYRRLDNIGEEGLANEYKNALKDLQIADLNIFECSLHSLSTGFLINKSLELHKPTITLYYQNNKPYLLSGIKNEKLIIKKYDKNNVKSVVKKAITQAISLRDKRFNLFMSDDLLQYLDEEAARQRINKSTFIRNLLLAHMKKTRKN